MPREPSEKVLEKFSIRVLARLGGRLNQHWLVTSQREQLVLRRCYQPSDSIDYESRLLAHLTKLGWPVPYVVAGPTTIDGHTWTLAPFLPGEPATDDPNTEGRARGRLLAHLHHDLAGLQNFGQRARWRRGEDILADTKLDQTLNLHEKDRTQEVRVLRWHLELARNIVTGLPLRERPGLVIHGDFTRWNLRFEGGRLSGILDFELAHWDHRVADFALAWRGKYDEVIRGYDEVTAFEPEEWALITPLWWAGLIEGACQDMRDGVRDDGWTLKKLLQRSALMGSEAVAFPSS